MILVAGIFIVRLFFLQVADTRYKHSAENNSQRTVIKYPARGLMYDRNGKLLVYNEAAYDLMIIPRQMKDFDTLEICKLLDIEKTNLLKAIKKAKNYSRYKPSVLVKQISAKKYAALQEKLYRYPGFFVQTRTLRKYPRPIAANILGYVGEVNDKITHSNPYYESGDYIGISGIEKSYEIYLRGEKGVEKFLVDVHNRIKGRYENGKHDTAAVVGKNLTLTIDAELQAYGEKLMQHKVGSIVAIEPSTGEVLAMISSPSYDPNLLTGRARTKNYKVLSNDTLKPLFNRAIMSRYSPGSIFKTIQALIGMQEGVINENTGFTCGGAPVKCHHHPNPSSVRKAIQYSCNPYFYKVFQRIIQQGKASSIFKDSEIGLKRWRNHILTFGLGVSLDLDIPGVKSGLIPGIELYNKWYGKGRWAFSTIYSNSIGQGEVETIPIQIANLATTIANKGYFYTPHFVKAIEGQDSIDEKYMVKNITSVESKYFTQVIEGMYSVVNEAGGTAVWGAKLDSIAICGKTGTVENTHGKDHSGFFAFAPKDNPKIAIAVYVENAGFGGVYAAPIASLMIEKYLTGEIKSKRREKRMLDYKQY
ncbi:MAG: penicillin-binding protein 2 [Marinilabiliales bacterium]|nr:MAG: penicillin-binding protein 2 [Marinilabiliales bacterium]